MQALPRSHTRGHFWAPVDAMLRQTDMFRKPSMDRRQIRDRFFCVRRVSAGGEADRIEPSKPQEAGEIAANMRFPGDAPLRTKATEAEHSQKVDQEPHARRPHDAVVAQATTQ